MPKPLTDGPLPIPASSTARVASRLRGHCTAVGWLPVGLDPAVDELRARHLAQRGRLVSALTNLSGAEAAFADQDRDHAAALIDAQRSGKPVVDKRTPHVEREAMLDDLDGVCVAAAVVMAEVVQETIDALRELEPGILGGLRELAAEGDDRIRRARQEVALAEQDHYALLRRGQWLQAVVDDGPFGQATAPVVGPVPPNISRASVAGALERPWHRVPTGAAA